MSEFSRITDEKLVNCETSRKMWSDRALAAEEKLREAPTTEAWQQLVHLACKEGSGAEMIYQITSNYNAMKARAEAAEAKVADLEHQRVNAFGEYAGYAGRSLMATVMKQRDQVCDKLVEAEKVLAAIPSPERLEEMASNILRSARFQAEWEEIDAMAAELRTLAEKIKEGCR